MDEQRTTSIRGLGEIARRVDDLDSMRAFYEDIVGLRLMKRFSFVSQKVSAGTRRSWPSATWSSSSPMTNR